MDFAAIRSRLADTEGRLYWRSLGELSDTPEFRDYLHREFPEQASEWNDPKGRRNFLKLMSASLALAGVGACTRQPPESIVPYVRQPEDLVPGRPLFFASAIPLGGIARPVLVESHMGRPTKIEGNPEHPASLGATDTLTQAAVLGLYDPDRAQTVTFRGEVRPWGAFQAAMASALAGQKAAGGAGLRILTEPITSPSLAELVATILRDYPSGPLASVRRRRVGTARAPACGRRPGPRGTRSITSKRRTSSSRSRPISWAASAPVRCATPATSPIAGASRTPSKQMNRLYVVESSPSLTGAKAEHRLPMKSGEIEGFAAKLAGIVGAGAPAAVPGTPAPGGELVEKWVAAVAKDLQAHRGRSVVIPGEYQPASVHALAHAMNQALGNVGATVSYTESIDPQPADPHASIAELATAMDAGQVQLLVILGNNPVFTAPADVKFAERLGKVSLVAYLGLYNDETANLAHWFVPEAHPLESWGDPRAYDGTVTLMQPLIAPLYDAHTAHEMLATLSNEPSRRTLDMVKDYWTRGFAGAGGWAPRTENGETFGNADAFWKQALHDGFIRGTATTAGGPATTLTAAPVTAPVMPAAGAATPGVVVLPATPSAATASPAAQAAPPASATPASTPTPPPAPARAGGLELVFRPDPTVWDGRFANNGWLQEAPKPLTKLTWDTAAWISPRLAETSGLDRGDVIELQVPRRHREDAGLHRPRPAGRDGDGLPRLRPPHGGTRRQRRRPGTGVQRLPAADVRRAVVRQRPGNHEDRRALPPGDDAGPSRDGRPRTRRGSARWRSTRRTRVTSAT